MTSKTLILIDFDGVINQFPDEKVRRRQNTTSWMKEGDPRIKIYSPDNWFIPDHKATVNTRWHGKLRILWSSELVSRLDALKTLGAGADILWLSTWQPYIDMLNEHLHVDWETVNWYNPVTREGRYTGKRQTVINSLRLNQPIVWIDDEETTYTAGLAITGNGPTAPVLAVGPDSNIGISRSQMTLIEQFVATSGACNGRSDESESAPVRFEVTDNGHEGHWGF